MGYLLLVQLISASDKNARIIFSHSANSSSVNISLGSKSGAYAREHNELDAFRASHRENIACKNDIEAAISRNFNGMHLKHDAVTDVLARHDPEPVKLVLASTIQDKEWDGRFLRSNKEWAATVQMPETATDSGFDRRYEYSVDTHPAVLDGFVSMFRKEISEREKSSVLSSLHSQPSKTDKPIKPKEQEACL